jgi:hypothetical protein
MLFGRFITQSFIIFLFLGSIAIGQVDFTLPLMYHDTSNYIDTMYWGLKPGASYCLMDSGEWELPPMACGLAVCVRFADIRPIGSGGCMGTGTLTDIRPSYSSSQIDTYRVLFDGIFPITFRWLPTLYQYYDSAKITFVGVTAPSINMMLQDSLVINDGNIRAIKIFTYGPKPPNGVGEFGNEQPELFVLEQNYPNPFNPTTNFEFHIPLIPPSEGGHRGMLVTLKVYDVLGKEVATLVDEKMEAGKHSVRWDAERVTSGVYYYKLTAKNFSETKKLLIIK